VKLIDLLLQL